MNKINYFYKKLYLDWEHKEKAVWAFGFVEEDDTLTVSAAYCSPKDQFCKKTARDIIAKRITEGNSVMLIKPITSKKYKHAILSHMSCYEDVWEVAGIRPPNIGKPVYLEVDLGVNW